MMFFFMRCSWYFAGLANVLFVVQLRANVLEHDYMLRRGGLQFHGLGSWELFWPQRGRSASSLGAAVPLQGRFHFLVWLHVGVVLLAPHDRRHHGLFSRARDTRCRSSNRNSHSSNAR